MTYRHTLVSMCSIFPLCAANISVNSWCPKGCSQQRGQWSGLSWPLHINSSIILTETIPSTQSESIYEMRWHVAKFITIPWNLSLFPSHLWGTEQSRGISKGKKNPQVFPFSQCYAALGYITHAYVAIQVCKTGRTPQAHLPLHQAGSPRGKCQAGCFHHEARTTFPHLVSPPEILLSTVIPQQIALHFSAAIQRTAKSFAQILGGF